MTRDDRVYLGAVVALWLYNDPVVTGDPGGVMPQRAERPVIDAANDPRELLDGWDFFEAQEAAVRLGEQGLLERASGGPWHDDFDSDERRPDAGDTLMVRPTAAGLFAVIG